MCPFGPSRSSINPASKSIIMRKTTDQRGTTDRQIASYKIVYILTQRLGRTQKQNGAKISFKRMLLHILTYNINSLRYFCVDFSCTSFLYFSGFSCFCKAMYNEQTKSIVNCKNHIVKLFKIYRRNR